MIRSTWVNVRARPRRELTLKSASIAAALMIVAGVVIGCESQVDRPDIASWAPQSQSIFESLTSIRADTPTHKCQQVGAVLEHAKSRLSPGPSAEIDKAFAAYLNALLDLYRECPSDARRAALLHDRANELGYKAELLINAAIDTANRRPSH